MGNMSALPALAATPPPNIGDQLQRLMALKTMLAQQKTQELQQTGMEQENQQRALALQDQQTLRSLAPQHIQKDGSGKITGFDTNGLLQDAAGKGVSPQTLNQMRLQYADAVQKTAAAGTSQIDLENRKNDQAYQILEGVRSVKDPAQRQQAYQQAAPKIQALGIDPSGLPPSADDTAIQAFEAHLGVHKQVLADAKSMAETTEARQKAEEAATGAAKNRAETQGLTGPFAEAKYRNILGAMTAGKPVSDDDLTFAKAYEASQAKSTTQSDSLGVTSTNRSGPAGLAAVGNRQGGKFVAGGAVPSPGGAGVSPQATKQSIVDLIGQYKMDPMLLSRMMYKHPEMVGIVHQSYPDWDQTNYQAKNKIVQSFTSGPESKSINAISTALGHAGELGTAIDALGNSDGMNMLRALGNAIGVKVLGNDKITAAKTIIHRLAPEITAAYVQGGGGEGERVANAEDFDLSLGDKQLRSNLGETVKLLRSKIAAQEQQWNNTYKPTRPEDDFSTRFLTPQAKDALQKYSPQAGGGASGGTAQHIAGGPSQGLQEGATGTGSDGKKYVVKGGKWVPQ